MCPPLSCTLGWGAICGCSPQPHGQPFSVQWHRHFVQWVPPRNYVVAGFKTERKWGRAAHKHTPQPSFCTLVAVHAEMPTKQTELPCQERNPPEGNIPYDTHWSLLGLLLPVANNFIIFHGKCLNQQVSQVSLWFWGMICASALQTLLKQLPLQLLFVYTPLLCSPKHAWHTLFLSFSLPITIVNKPSLKQFICLATP